MTRRGYSLVELLVAITLTAMVAILIGGIVARSSTFLRDRSERFSMEQALRVSFGAVRSVVEPMGSDSGSDADLRVLSATGLTGRVTRATGVLCEAQGDRVLARAGTSWWRATRGLVGGRDSLLLRTLGDARGWVAVRLEATPTSGVCPDGDAALVLPVTLGAADLAEIGMGSPILGFEPVELRLYSSSVASWLGARLTATGEAIQPLAGPLGTPAAWSFLDEAGMTAASPESVVEIRLAIEGRTERNGGVGVARLNRSRSDSAWTTIALRGRQ